MKQLQFTFNVILLSLMVTVPSGSFFFSEYIENKISNNTASTSEVLFAIKRGVKQALQYRLLQVEFRSNEWFYLAKTVGKSEKHTAFELATIYQIEGDTEKAIYWYKIAVNLKHNKASQELIDLYINEGHLEKAKALLLPLKEQEESLLQLMQVSLTLGDLDLVKELIPLITFPEGKNLLNDLKQFSVLPQIYFKENEPSINTESDCGNNIQLFATSLQHLHQLDTLIENAKKHPISQFFCFNKPRYISAELLKCQYNPRSAIRCNETIWADITPAINTRYIGLMLKRGGANVNNGILYIDANDTVNVLVHELSHLVGFVDEYPLPRQHRVCQKAQKNKFSHNISILPPIYTGTRSELMDLLQKQIPWINLIDKNVPLFEKLGDKWIIGTPEKYIKNNRTKVGLFKSETCNKSSMQAFKPTLMHSNLRYYEEAFPALYLMLLEQNPNDYLMPSYHYNVAKSFFRKDEESKGFLWLKKALEQETPLLKSKSKVNRYNKIKQGQY